MTAPATTDVVPLYDEAYPAIIQNHDWDCAEESTRWTLYAWGRRPDDAWMEASMLDAGVVNPAVGCTDATGAGLARWVNDTYGEDGYVAASQTNVTFDQVAQEAGSLLHPLAMGGAGWNHWTGVRGYDPTADVLLLANPAPGWHQVYQTMSRGQFGNLSPFHMLRVTHPEAEAGGGDTIRPEPTPIGIDVASHQGMIDWSKVASGGCSFGFTKATGGAWYDNPYLTSNWNQMKAAGVKRGAYHYAFEPSGQTLPGPGPEAEAQYFLDRMLPLGLSVGDMLVLDIEDGQGNLAQWALAWLRYVEARVGFKPLVYSGTWFTDSHGFPGEPALAEYPLWQASYQEHWPPPAQPWSKLTFWQFTDSGSVPGVPSLVDQNRFQGTEAQMASIGMAATNGSSGNIHDWDGYIGSGLLELMAQDNTLPAQRWSTWLPLGAPPPADVEECLGQNGVYYRWSLELSRGWRYRPS